MKYSAFYKALQILSCKDSSILHLPDAKQKQVLNSRIERLRKHFQELGLELPDDYSLESPACLNPLFENVDFPNCPICGEGMKFWMNFGYYMLSLSMEYHYELVYIMERPRHYHEWLWSCPRCKLQFYPVDSFEGMDFPTDFDQKDGAKLFRKGLVGRRIGYTAHHGKARKYYKRRRSYTYIPIRRNACMHEGGEN